MTINHNSKNKILNLIFRSFQNIPHLSCKFEHFWFFFIWFVRHSVRTYRYLNLFYTPHRDCAPGLFSFFLLAVFNSYFDLLQLIISTSCKCLPRILNRKHVSTELSPWSITSTHSKNELSWSHQHIYDSYKIVITLLW